ncbi:hypothetical protein LIER_30466 [Lithospermum erythrorhizon]|uniref:RNase H type-1 domain-containing protein n=1 Tax=Lithospermum erythrorhizon TaxID=34254 RepID=A0AAV3RSZ0_LITER
MQPPSEYKDIQKLTGCLVALSRFISKSGERNLPFFKNLRRASSTKFYWDDECNKAFEELNEYLGDSPKLLSQAEQGKVLQLYLAVSNGAVNGDINEKGSGAGIMICGPGEVIIEFALRFTFPTTKNEAEYEALIAGLAIVKSLGMNNIWVKGDSKLVTDQVKGLYRVRHELLVKYHVRVVQLAKKFEQVVFEHIPRVQNKEADHLSRLATTYYDELPKGVYVEIREKPAHEEIISIPVLEEPEDWRTSIARYLVTGQLLKSVTEARKIKNRSFRFYMYGE